MRDQPQFDIVTAKHLGVSWRIFELECLEKYFGQSDEGSPGGINAMYIQRCGAKYLYWKIHTESTDKNLWGHCYRTAEEMSKYGGIKHINDPRGWLACHAKEKAFEIWERVGVPCPKWFEFTNIHNFFKNCTFGYPMLLRLNNSTSGWFSYLCRNEAEVKEAIPKLQSKIHYHHDKIPNEGVGRKLIAVQFIPTTRPENLNMSFRIIVAGDKVVTGYARLAPPSDWIAITNRFTPEMEKPFVKYQKVCQTFCEENEALIVKSVRSLGLNFQGVDVILDREDKPYFIEVQPGFSVGYPHRTSWRPPFYNPSKPDTLRNFLLQNLDRLKEEIPMYANLWLDKYAMFNKAFGALKKQLG
jgi:glutathione synthase/RimK-type ligase-like ATP-grasp enzyme